MVLGTLIALSTPRSKGPPRRGASRRKRPKPRSRDRLLLSLAVLWILLAAVWAALAAFGAGDPPPGRRSSARIEA